MYLHVKIILFSIILVVTAISIYSFRDYLPDLALLSQKTFNKQKESSPSQKVLTSRKEINPKQNQQKSGNRLVFEKKYQRAKKLFDEKELISARKLAENILLDPKLTKYDSNWLRAAELLSQINTLFLFTDAMCPEKKVYSVAKGDNLITIANKFNTTVNLIQKSNLLDETNPNIYPNQVFRIFHGDWKIKVIKNSYLLLLNNGENLVKIYPVGTGRQDRTPVGIFIIDVKEFEPEWWRPGKLVPFGDPENVLGTRWLGLKPIEGTNPGLKGYGIHGTWEPQTIGHSASQGCVRMVNENVEELFDIVPSNTRVVITE